MPVARCWILVFEYDNLSCIQDQVSSIMFKIPWLQNSMTPILQVSLQDVKFFCPKNKVLFGIDHAPVAQLDRASDFGSEGWGSSPSGRTTLFKEKAHFLVSFFIQK